MTFASIVTLVQVVFFAAIFLLFISGSVGWTLIYAFVLALVASIVITLISHSRYSVELEQFSGMTTVGGECDVRVTVRKKGFCFVPYLTLEGSFSGKSFTVKTSLLFKSCATVDLRLKPTECGLQKVVINRSYTEDFLWLLRLKRQWEVCSSVAVLPRVVEYIGPQVTPSLLPSDSEEREEGASVMLGGAAGYEHREYVHGDSPRRINYKLSAKKQRLMVRLDETNGTESTNIILAAGANGDCAEQAYALACKLVMSGSPAAVCHGIDRCETSSPDTLGGLREWLAFRNLHSKAETPTPDGTVCVVISPDGIRV